MDDESDQENEREADPDAARLANLPAFNTRKNEMPEELYYKALGKCVDAFKAHRLQKDIAQAIKQALDADDDFNELMGKGPWQVIVGRSFASAVTHEAMHIAFFDLPKYQETILIYKSLGVQNI